MLDTQRLPRKLFLGPLLPGVVALALGACGGGNSGSTSAPSNGSPSISGITLSPPAPVLSFVTQTKLTAVAIDPDGDPLTYNWNFGDGQAGAGQIVQHTFVSEGSLSVILTVTDGKGHQVTLTSTVVARTLTGQWRDLDPAWEMTVTQNGTAFTGTVTRAGVGLVSQIRDGVLTDPRNLRFFRDSSVSPPWYLGYTGNYAGSLDTTLNRIQLVSPEDSRFTYDLTRQ